MNEIISIMLGFLIGMVFTIILLETLGYEEQKINKGLAIAVACAPGTYLEDLDHGWVLCIGGEKETWRVKP